MIANDYGLQDMIIGDHGLQDMIIGDHGLEDTIIGDHGTWIEGVVVGIWSLKNWLPSDPMVCASCIGIFNLLPFTNYKS